MSISFPLRIVERNPTISSLRDWQTDEKEISEWCLVPRSSPTNQQSCLSRFFSPPVFVPIQTRQRSDYYYSDIWKIKQWPSVLFVLTSHRRRTEGGENSHQYNEINQYLITLIMLRIMLENFIEANFKSAIFQWIWCHVNLCLGENRLVSRFTWEFTIILGRPTSPRAWCGASPANWAEFPDSLGRSYNITELIINIDCGSVKYFHS